MFPILRISGLLSLHLALMILLLLHGIHGLLLFDVQTGFDTSVMKEAFSGISLIETLRLVEARDYLSFLFPFGLFWLMFLSPIRLRIWVGRVFVTLVVFLLLLSLLVTDDKAKKVPDEIRFNPAIFLLSDVARNAFFTHPIQGQIIGVATGKRVSIQSFRPMKINLIGPAAVLPPTKKGDSLRPPALYF